MDRLNPRIIGYIRGRPIHLIGGGSEPAGEEPPGELGDLLGGDDGGGGDDGTEDPPRVTSATRGRWRGRRSATPVSASARKRGS
jgi:hypothetical protein